MRGGDSLRLAFLRSAAQQDHEPIAVLSEVNAIAGSESDPVFKDPTAHAFDVREIALLNSRQGCRDARGGVMVKPRKPVGKRPISFFVNIAAQSHNFFKNGNRYVTSFEVLKNHPFCFSLLEGQRADPLAA